MNPPDRIEYIDLAKGICILLVVLDHISDEGYFSDGNYPLNEIFEQMRMPLYFILSGLFFKDYQGGIREFLLRKVNRILVPYLFFFLLLRGSSWLVRNYTSFASTGVNIDSIWSPLWFLRCLFIMNIIFALTYYGVRRLTSNKLTQDILLGISMFAFGIAGYYTGDVPLNIGSAMTSMPLLWAGFILNRRLNVLQKRIPWWWALASSLCLFVMLHFTYMGELYFFRNTYSSPLPILYITGFSGSPAAEQRRQEAARHLLHRTLLHHRALHASGNHNTPCCRPPFPARAIPADRPHREPHLPCHHHRILHALLLAPEEAPALVHSAEGFAQDTRKQSVAQPTNRLSAAAICSASLLPSPTTQAEF